MATDKELDEYDENFEETRAAVLANPIARAAAMENALRRQIAEGCASAVDGFNTEFTDRVKKYFPRCHSHTKEIEIARRTGCSTIEVSRTLNTEWGGELSLLAICKVLDFLGLEMKIEINRKG